MESNLPYRGAQTVPRITVEGAFVGGWAGDHSHVRSLYPPAPLSRLHFMRINVHCHNRSFVLCRKCWVIWSQQIIFRFEIIRIGGRVFLSVSPYQGEATTRKFKILGMQGLYFTSPAYQHHLQIYPLQVVSSLYRRLHSVTNTSASL